MQKNAIDGREEEEFQINRIFPPHFVMRLHRAKPVIFSIQRLMELFGSDTNMCSTTTGAPK